MPHKRSRPAGNRAARTDTTLYRQSNGHRPQDCYAAATAEDRREQAVLAEAYALGYRLSLTCIDCGHWLTNPISVAAMRRPRCRAKAI
jgi:hypothetical protein